MTKQEFVPLLVTSIVQGLMASNRYPDPSWYPDPDWLLAHAEATAQALERRGYFR